MPDHINSWDKTFRSLGSENQSRRHSACTLPKSRGQVWLTNPNKQRAQTETTNAINTVGLGNTSHAYTAFWKSGVHKIIFIVVLLSCSTLEVKGSIYWNFSIKVPSLDSIFKGGYLNSRNKEHMHR